MTRPPPARRMAITRKPPVSGTSDLLAISVLRSNSPQSDLHANPARPELASARQANREAADGFAANVLPVIETLRAAGVTSLAGLAAALNERGVRTARGARWHATSVRNLLQRSHRGTVSASRRRPHRLRIMRDKF
jgi:hypothetical protein